MLLDFAFGVDGNKISAMLYPCLFALPPLVMCNPLLSGDLAATGGVSISPEGVTLPRDWPLGQAFRPADHMIVGNEDLTLMAELHV
ncbi:hypothetical protein A5680_07805 [Mycobacterium sp. E2989]|nr:hypothetical protein A5680_07805 [Mycobacterium sp. E2989]